MYAVIQVGSKQYQVAVGDRILVDLLAEGQEEVAFEQVLLCHDGKKIKMGGSTVEGMSVKGKVIGLVKGPKVIAYKYKRRKNYRRKVGHRQKYHQIEITAIQG